MEAGDCVKLLQLRYFQTICKYNNLTKAAKELYVSQSTLSGTVKELEEEFGVPLFYRRSKGLVLTQAGQVLLEEAGRLLQQAQELEQHMQAMAGEGQSIQLGVSPMAGTLLLPEIFQAFHDTFPHIKLQVRENGTLVNQDLLVQGELDAAILSTQGPLAPPLKGLPVATLNLFLYVSRKNKLAGETQVDLSQLGEQPLVLLTEESFVTNYITQCFEKQGIVPNVMLHTNQLTTIRRLLDKDAAATFLFDPIFAQDEDVTKIPVRGLEEIHVSLVWNDRQKLSGPVRNLIHLVQANL